MRGIVLFPYRKQLNRGAIFRQKHQLEIDFRKAEAPPLGRNDNGNIPYPTSEAPPFGRHMKAEIQNPRPEAPSFDTK